jgi:hypothetical protein
MSPIKPSPRRHWLKTLLAASVTTSLALVQALPLHKPITPTNRSVWWCLLRPAA